jgi:hypothetical protein
MESRKYKYRIVTSQEYYSFEIERAPISWFRRILDFGWRYYRGEHTIEAAKLLVAKAIKDDNWVKQVVEE